MNRIKSHFFGFMGSFDFKNLSLLQILGQTLIGFEFLLGDSLIKIKMLDKNASQIAEMLVITRVEFSDSLAYLALLLLDVSLFALKSPLHLLTLNHLILDDLQVLVVDLVALGIGCSNEHGRDWLLPSVALGFVAVLTASSSLQRLVLVQTGPIKGGLRVHVAILAQVAAEFPSKSSKLIKFVLKP